MTKLFEKAVLTVGDLPPDMQDDIARMVLMLAGQDRSFITPEKKALLEKSLKQARRGEFAGGDQIQAV